MNTLRPQGFLLFEVLITLFFMSVLILPLLRYQINALHMTEKNNETSIAEITQDNDIERLHFH